MRPIACSGAGIAATATHSPHRQGGTNPQTRGRKQTATTMATVMTTSRQGQNSPAAGVGTHCRVGETHQHDRPWDIPQIAYSHYSLAGSAGAAYGQHDEAFLFISASFC